MPRRKNSIYLVIKKGVFLGLFPFVLLVQCIWAPQSSSFYSQANVSTTVLLQKENGKTTVSSPHKPVGHKKGHTRLNKRFQRGDILATIEDLRDSLRIYFTNVDKLTPCEEYIFSSFTLVLSFRGPPVVA